MSWVSNLFGGSGHNDAGNAWAELITGIPNVGDARGYLTGSATNQKQYQYSQMLQDSQNAFNSSEAKKAYDRQIDYYDYVANYNSPANQMRRLEQAGLNPNLVYGNGAMATQAAVGSVTPARSGSAVMSAVPDRIASFLTAISDIGFKTVQARQIMQQNSESRAREAEIAARVGKTEAEKAKVIADTVDKKLEIERKQNGTDKLGGVGTVIAQQLHNNGIDGVDLNYTPRGSSSSGNSDEWIASKLRQADQFLNDTIFRETLEQRRSRTEDLGRPVEDVERKKRIEEKYNEFLRYHGRPYRHDKPRVTTDSQGNPIFEFYYAD